MQWYIGTSGWSYKDWKNRFYPGDISEHNQRLKYYADTFNTTEVNSSFYKIPPKETVEQWIKTVPENFRFVIKLNRYFTHLKRLKADEAVAGKYESFRHSPDILAPHMGPLLVQLPGNMKKNPERLEEWLFHMPALKYAFEFRHSSWFEPDIYDILKKYNAALVYSHNTEFPTELRCTANFMYIRFHGPDKPYYSNYSKDQLAGEYEKVQLFMHECKELYVFFNNTYKAYAVENAKQWKELTG